MLWHCISCEFCDKVFKAFCDLKHHEKNIHQSETQAGNVGKRSIKKVRKENQNEVNKAAFKDFLSKFDHQGVKSEMNMNGQINVMSQFETHNYPSKNDAQVEDNQNNIELLKEQLSANIVCNICQIRFLYFHDYESHVFKRHTDTINSN